MKRLIAVTVIAATALFAVPAHGGERADQRRAATKQADRMMRAHARNVAAYHERLGTCQRRSVPVQTNGPRTGAWVCFYYLTGYNKTGARYECARVRVVVKDRRAPEFMGGRCA